MPRKNSLPARTRAYLSPPRLPRAYFLNMLTRLARPHLKQNPYPPTPKNFKKFAPRPARATWPRGPRGLKPVDRTPLVMRTTAMIAISSLRKGLVRYIKNL